MEVIKDMESRTFKLDLFAGGFISIRPTTLEYMKGSFGDLLGKIIDNVMADMLRKFLEGIEKHLEEMKEWCKKKATEILDLSRTIDLTIEPLNIIDRLILSVVSQINRKVEFLKALALFLKALAFLFYLPTMEAGREGAVFHHKETREEESQRIKFCLVKQVNATW